MTDGQIILAPADVCTLLQIKDSTLRKYALILEKSSYHFDKNSKGQRAFYEKDVIAIRKLIEIKEGSDMTLEQAANAVVSWFEQSDMSLRVMEENEVNKRYNTDMQEMKDMINKQNQIIMQLVEQVKNQQKYIEDRLDKRDNLLMDSIREAQETKQLLLAAHEEQEKKKGIFGWFKK